ncbi:MAG TPA: hypothetical protein VGQ27_01845 [Steroidobacteraceae bacterium]|jgi:xanthine/uracil permease|nr:hypothetical protein [Steroidobacteraceae bacterium]
MKQDPQGPPATTPASIQLALVMYAIAIAVPLFALASVRDSHDGFKIFGTFLLSLGASGLAALIGIIGTMIGATRSPHTAWTTLAIVLGCVSGLGLLYFLSLAAR